MAIVRSQPFAPDGDGDDRRRQPVERKRLGDLALPARVDRVEERRPGKGGKHAIAFGEIHRRVVEAGIGEIDGVSAARSLTRLHDRLLRDEEIGSRSENLDQPGTLTVPEFQALRLARRLDIAGAKVGLPVRLIAFEMDLGRSVELAGKLSVGRRHHTLSCSDPAVGPSHRRPQRERDHRRAEQPHARLHALSRRTASSISAVEPAKEMRSVPAPRARSKSTPGVVATPASASMRLQKSRLSLVRWATSQ